MINRLKALLAAPFTKTFKKITQSKQEFYLTLLDQFDDTVKREDFPIMLVELWKRIDINDLTNLSAREMMSIDFDLRHENITMLIEKINEANTLVNVEDADTLQHIARYDFIKFIRVNMDEYLSDARGYAVELKPSLQKLKDGLIYHGMILETKTDGHYRRCLSRIYYDVLSLTKVLVEQMEKNMKPN